MVYPTEIWTYLMEELTVALLCGNVNLPFVNESSSFVNAK
jgi:hypothetical protein